MSPVDYAGTKLIGVRRVEEGVRIAPLAHGQDLTLTPDEWEDLVYLALLFAERAERIAR